MKFEPHPYQKYAISFILSHPICAVLLDMGLGKTVITLTAIYTLLYDYFSISSVLVVAPLRVARDTWPQEAKKWDHLRGLRVSVVVGTETERRAALMRKADVYVINRECLGWLVESGVDWKADMLVLDELSSFKNAKSKRTKAVMAIRRRVKRIVGLTGTPAPNGLMDVFSEYRVLDGGERLGRFITRYREKYFQPDKTNGLVVYSYKPLPFAEEAIYKKIEDITISMKSGDYLEMPEKIETEYEVEMDEKEKKIYETLKKDLVVGLGDDFVTAANAASLCGKLSQLANGAVYTDDKKVFRFHERKLDALEDLIEAANGKPVLVSYWYQHDLDGIEDRLKARKIKYEKLDSEESIGRWNRGELPVALIHPASAGHGLNLQSGGNMLIWFGLTGGSLELYQQTNCRLWRQGQKAKTVIIEHIITKGTVDEKILKALKNKNATQEDMIAAVKAEIKR